MSKQSGLADNCYVDGVNLSGDVGSLGAIGGGPSPLDVTGIDKSAMERLGGLRDGRIEWSSWFNPTRAHDLLSTLPLTNRLVTYLRGTALGGQAASLVGKQIGYDPTRGTDGSLTIALAAQGDGFGLEWLRQLTAGIRTDTAATNGTGVDFTAGSSFGLQTYLHVFAFTGTSATVKLQHSNDDGAVDPYTDITGATFTAVTAAPTSERLQTARNAAIKRWIRAVTTGTFSNLQFAVATSGPNPTNTVF